MFIQQQGFLQRVKRRQRRGVISKAELKLLLASLTFIGFGVITLLYGVITGVTNEAAFEVYSVYFACESMGHIPGKCNREKVESYNNFPLSVLFHTFLGLVPFANFLVVFNMRIARGKILTWCFGHTKKAKARRYSRQLSQSQIPKRRTFLFRPCKPTDFERRLSQIQLA